MELRSASVSANAHATAQRELGNPYLAMQHDDGNAAVSWGGGGIGDQHVAWINAAVNQRLAQHANGVAVGAA